MAKRRVVVTGLGIVSAVGNDVKTAWGNILAGRSGIAPYADIDFDASRFPTRFAGQVRNFDASRVISSRDARRLDVFIHYGLAAAVEAIDHSGLTVDEGNTDRIGVHIGSGIGGINGIEKTHDAYLDGGPRKISPFFVPGNIINMISGQVSIMYGIKGPNLSTVTACTTSTHSIGLSARLIQYGDADVMIAGGAEMATTPIALGGFCAARALSTRNDDPEGASRPFDRDRDGFVIGDGGSVLVLEEYEHARRRGATIYAELIGFGMSADAFHMTQPSEGGEGASKCMVNAMHDAELNPDGISYINAHGTSTPAGDVAETNAIKLAMGDAAKRIPVSSTKSMTGHMLGAAGSTEAIFSVLALHEQVAPPTINLDNPDPACDLDYVPGSAREIKMDTALSNSFGFGGTNGTLIFRRAP